MARGKQDSYKRRREAACVTIVELQAELEREREKRRTAQRLATIDGLTRLHNRRAFNAEGRPRFLRSKRWVTSVAMFFIDADGFKAVNDLHGHTVGDALLTAIARAIKRSTRPSDLTGKGKRRNLAGRKGGDEFVLFFDHLDEVGARIVAHRIHEAVQAIRLRRAPDVRASVSIGVVVGIPTADLEWKGIIDLADTAMYEAKKLKGTGQPTICIHPLT